MTARRWRSLLLATLALATVAWLALRTPPGAESDPHLLRREFMLMGTLATVSLDLDERMPATRAEAALDDLQQFLSAFAQRWSMRDGELARLNQQLAGGNAITVPDDMQTLFAEAQRAQTQSAGRFDVRIGALVKLWGFDDLTRLRSAPPPQADIEELTALLHSAAALNDRLYGPARVQLDFGAIAKGYACDLALARLRSAGFGNALVNLGGNLRASGHHGLRPWQIGIRHPRADAPDNAHGSLLATLTLQDGEAVMTSGDYERYFEDHGRRYHHLLDPATGEPAQGLISVSVVHPQGAWADAASTALFVAGPAHWRDTALAMGITQALVVDAQGRILATPALAPRLHLADGLQLHDTP